MPSEPGRGLPLLRPDWPAAPDVGAAMSTRSGGVSSGALGSLNLGVAVGDDAAAVAENRRRFAAAIGARPVWLRQVHGTTVLRLHADSPDAPDTAADAAWTDTPGIACTVQAADCLPVLFALRDGSAVAAAHAGWRGLAAGVLEAVIGELRRARGARPDDLLAWLGPCIGPRQFEVGADVLQAFGAGDAAATGASAPCFAFSPRADGAARWRADLPGLARHRLRAAGVGAVHGGLACTVEDASAFFSFRRDGVTGRMAAAVWLR